MSEEGKTPVERLAQKRDNIRIAVSNAGGFEATKTSAFRESIDAFAAAVREEALAGAADKVLAFAREFSSDVRVYERHEDCEYVTEPEQARKRGLALIAAADEAERLQKARGT